VCHARLHSTKAARAQDMTCSPPRGRPCPPANSKRAWTRQLKLDLDMFSTPEYTGAHLMCSGVHLMYSGAHLMCSGMILAYAYHCRLRSGWVAKRQLVSRGKQAAVSRAAHCLGWMCGLVPHSPGRPSGAGWLMGGWPLVQRQAGGPGAVQPAGEGGLREGRGSTQSSRHRAHGTCPHFTLRAR